MTTAEVLIDCIKKISSTLEQELQIAILKKAVVFDEQYKKKNRKWKKNSYSIYKRKLWD